MKKKHFILVLLACLLFFLIFATCDDDYKKESVPGLWEKIRNTAWTMEKTVTEGGEEFHVTYTVGFYRAPRAVIRIVLDDAPDKWHTGHYEITDLDDLKISRTGDKIYFRDYDVVWSGSTFTFKDTTGSFNITVSGNTLTISHININMNREVIGVGDTTFTEATVDWDYIGRINNKIKGQINGTYSKYNSDPNYAFNEGWEITWPKIKNTAWKKEGSSKPSVGFYE